MLVHTLWVRFHVCKGDVEGWTRGCLGIELNDL